MALSQSVYIEDAAHFLGNELGVLLKIQRGLQCWAEIREMRWLGVPRIKRGKGACGFYDALERNLREMFVEMRSVYFFAELWVIPSSLK